MSRPTSRKPVRLTSNALGISRISYATIYTFIPIFLDNILHLIPEYSNPTDRTITTTRIRTVISRHPLSRLSVAHLDTYGSPSGVGGQGNHIIESFVLGSSRAKRSIRGQRPTLNDFSTTFRLRLPAVRRAQTFGSDTEEYGFATPSLRGFRDWHIHWSVARIQIRRSPTSVVTTFYSRLATDTASTTNYPLNYALPSPPVFYVPGWRSTFVLFRVLNGEPLK